MDGNLIFKYDLCFSYSNHTSSTGTTKALRKNPWIQTAQIAHFKIATASPGFYVISVQNLVKCSYGLAIFLLIANILIAVLTVIGNMTVILLVKVYNQLRVPSNLLLASLSVADLTNGLVLQRANVLKIYEAVTQPVVFSSKLVEFYDAVGLTILLANMITLCLITLDRFIAIEYSLRYVSLVTTSRVKCSIVATWIISVVVGVSSSTLIPVSGGSRVLFHGMLVLAAFFMISLYMKIYCVSRKHRKQIRAEQLARDPNMGTVNERRGLRTTAMVTMILVTSYVPIFIFTVEASVNDDSSVNESHQIMRDALRQVSHVLLFLNAALNPLLYFFRNKKARYYTRKMYRSVLTKLSG